VFVYGVEFGDNSIVSVKVGPELIKWICRAPASIPGCK
jgi:hypothetical protein